MLLKELFESTDRRMRYQAVMHLKDALVAKKKELQSLNDSDEVYKVIDRIMMKICKVHNLTGQQLHDLWVEKFKEVPDTWIMHQ